MKQILYTCDLCASRRSMLGLSSNFQLLSHLTHLVAYSRKMSLLIHPFLDALTMTPTGTSSVHASTTLEPLWITTGGTICPMALAKVRTVVFSPVLWRQLEMQVSLSHQPLPFPLGHLGTHSHQNSRFVLGNQFLTPCTDYLAPYSKTEMYLLKYRSKMDCSVSVHWDVVKKKWNVLVSGVPFPKCCRGIASRFCHRCHRHMLQPMPPAQLIVLCQSIYHRLFVPQVQVHILMGPATRLALSVRVSVRVIIHLVPLTFWCWLTFLFSRQFTFQCPAHCYWTKRSKN